MPAIGRRACVALAVSLASAVAPAARVGRAQSWPAGPVRFIVPFAPGGPVEVPARFLAEHLHAPLGQPVIVETRPGAGGAIGTRHVVQTNDPHVLLFTTSAVAIAPALMRNPGYDPLADLVPITTVTEAPLLLLARADSPIRDLPDLLARARAAPGRITYATSGVGSTTHLAGALFAQRAGVELLHVPYRGVGQAISALLAGDTDLMLVGTIEGLQQIRGGRARAIAVTTARRMALLPDVPAVAEAVPGYDMSIWYALFGPPATPPAVVERLAALLAPFARGSALARRMEEAGAALLLDGPAPLAERMRREVPMWRELAQAAGITAE
jgi:tripartite-type tricarboxylate transporter receptor subunit TctC